MNQTCRDFQELIPELLAETLQAEQAAKLREHISKCADCRKYLEALQADDQMLSAFVESVKPSIESIENKVIKQLDSELIEKPAGSISTWHKITKTRLIEYSAAAAIFLIAALLLFNVPSAKAITLSQIYEALEKVQNVYISKWNPKITGPIQEVWVSRSLNIRLLTLPGQIVLYDISNTLEKTKYLSSGLIEESQMSEELLQNMQEKINWGFSLTPFSEQNQHSELSWYRVDNVESEESTHNTEIYELAWVEISGLPSKFRLYVDIETNLPQMIEYYAKADIADDFTLLSFEKYTVLNESELKAVIQREFGSSDIMD